MSKSIHKTAKQIIRDNSKADLADPTNPDLVNYAKKIRYKKQSRQKRAKGKYHNPNSRVYANHTDHILISGEEESGNIYLDVDDWELFNFLEDFLTEQCGIKYDYFKEITEKNRTIYRMYFLNDYTFVTICEAVKKLSSPEIERIYSINNIE